MWDLGGQAHYAALLQPYIVSGSLYLLLVPVDNVIELESRKSELLTRWLDYLQVGVAGELTWSGQKHRRNCFRRVQTEGRIPYCAHQR